MLCRPSKSRTKNLPGKKCKFETSAKGQSRRTNRWFSSFDRVAARTSSHGNHNPTPENPIFIAFQSSGPDHCQGNRVSWRQTKMGRNSSLRFDATLTTSATTVSCFLPSTVLTSQINGEMTRTHLSSVLYLRRIFFRPHRRFHYVFVNVHSSFCSFCSHTSHHLISLYVQYDGGAHTAERSSDASELRAVRQAPQGRGTKLLLLQT